MKAQAQLEIANLLDHLRANRPATNDFVGTRMKEAISRTAEADGALQGPDELPEGDP